MTVRHRFLAGLLGTTLIAGVAGCADGAGSAASPTDTSTTTSSGSTSSSSSTSQSPSSRDSSTSSSSATETSSSSASSTSAAGSVADNSSSFSVTPPSGWKKVAQTTAATITLAISAPDATDGVYTNFNVVRQSTSGQSFTVTDLSDQGATAMRQQGGTVTTIAGRTIGNEQAAGYLVSRTASGKKVSQTQYFVIHNGYVYITTQTCAESAKSASDTAMNSILDSWSWS